MLFFEGHAKTQKQQKKHPIIAYPTDPNFSEK